MKSKTLRVIGYRLMVIVFLLSPLTSHLSPLHSQELLNYPLDTINGEEVYKYEVEKSIGLYRIGVNFNVSQNDIVRLNPQLRERGLHYGETLYIPTNRKVVKVSGERLEVSGESLPIVSDSIRINPVQSDTIRINPIVSDTIVADTILPDTRRVIELALLLPFESQHPKRSGNAERMMELYQGALLALHDLQNDSTLYRLRVYDSERSERRVQALCDSTELDSVRGVLGLIYPIQIERMAAWCAAHQVPLLLPFSDDIDLASHPQVMQFNSTDTQEADSLCQWLLSKDSTIHCVAVEVRDADIAPSVRALRKQIQANGLTLTGLALHDLMVDSCTHALDATKENVIVLHSDRFQNVRMVLPHLAKLQEAGYRIRIISQYSWQKEHINLPQVYTSMFKSNADHAAYDTLWEQTYAGGHVSETPRYDLLGYDLMKALVERVSGLELSGLVEGLQSDIRWTQVNEGGYQNACVRVIAY